ncbi:MAG: copper-binding protein [Hyphomonadaceae bacterium]|nr:copper-binding protein [Hyphomonadaceae bacterium]
MTKHLILAMAAALSFGVAAPAFAHEGREHAAQAQAPQSAEGVGVVRAIDARNNRVTIAHEPIPALGWPSMTMAFPLHAADLLTGVAVGDRVSFTLINHDGQPMVSALHVQR